MYGFVDTLPGSAQSASLSLQTVFDGINLDEELTDEDGSFITLTVSGRSNTTYRRNIIPIPGMEGAWEDANGYQDPRSITVKFKIKDKTNNGFRERLKRLNSLLVGSKKVLTFTDEDALFYASLEELELPEEESNDLVGNLHFICPDPFSYGPEKTRHLLPDVSTIKNEGTANAKPIIEMTAKESVTYALIQNQNDLEQLGDEWYPKYLMIGKPHEVDETPFERYVRRYYTNANTLVGWTKASNSDIDGGTVAGNIVSRNNRFVADSYGTGSNWHGPAIKTSLESPIRDFRLSAFVGFMNQQQAAMVGRLEIYLLDVNGNAVAKMALKDTSATRAAVFAEMRAGDRETNDMIISGFPNRETGWNNFSGQLRISREWDDRKKENVWSAYVALVDTSTGRHYARRIVPEWRDGGKYTRNVAQIVVHMGAVGTHTPVHANSGVSSIILEEIIQEPAGIPYIAHEGDKITFDCMTRDVYLNGEPVPDLMEDFGWSYFDLVKGDNQLVVHPSAFDTVLRYRPTYR